MQVVSTNWVISCYLTSCGFYEEKEDIEQGEEAVSPGTSNDLAVGLGDEGVGEVVDKGGGEDDVDGKST